MRYCYQKCNTNSRESRFQSFGLNQPKTKKAVRNGQPFSVNEGIAYNKVVGQTYSVFGRDVALISLKPPITSTKFS